MGFTWECDVHWYYQRLAYARQVLGTPAEMFALAAALEHPATVERSTVG